MASQPATHVHPHHRRAAMGVVAAVAAAVEDIRGTTTAQVAGRSGEVAAVSEAALLHGAATAKAAVAPEVTEGRVAEAAIAVVIVDRGRNVLIPRRHRRLPMLPSSVTESQRHDPSI
mmetsp:Transcript_24674/g.55632  ORF Transcript_24674/g.55632 Transcript_24674/m.55632 type:complete len:117 (-) Transcript_24674:18-368(-)